MCSCLCPAYLVLVVIMYIGIIVCICIYSKISIIRTMIIRKSGLIQTLMNVPFLMYGVHMWLVN